MEHQKILNLLNEASDSRFVTINWNIVYDQLNANDSAGNEIINRKEVLKCNFCDYSDVYILVRDDNTIIGHNVTQVAVRIYEPCIKCIS